MTFDTPRTCTPLSQRLCLTLSLQALHAYTICAQHTLWCTHAHTDISRINTACRSARAERGPPVPSPGIAPSYLPPPLIRHPILRINTACLFSARGARSPGIAPSYLPPGAIRSHESDAEDYTCPPSFGPFNVDTVGRTSVTAIHVVTTFGF